MNETKIWGACIQSLVILLDLSSQAGGKVPTIHGSRLKPLEITLGKDDFKDGNLY
jgi:hypothetical protein